MRQVLKGTARKFKIYMADDSDPTAGKTGLTTFTVYLAKDGTAEATVSPTIAERGRGWYEVTPATSHRDTEGYNAWTFVASGAKDALWLEEVIPVDFRDAAGLGLAVLQNEVSATDNSDGTFDLAFRNAADDATLLTVRVTPATGEREVL